MEGETVSIGVVNDTKSLEKSIEKLVDGYNSFIDSASMHSQASGNRSSFLMEDMHRIVMNYAEGLQSMGFEIEESGRLSLAETADGEKALHLGNPLESANTLKNFAESLNRKAGQVSIDPMQYIDKVLVAYKNPTVPKFPTPYITSAYSGMLFNSYC